MSNPKTSKTRRRKDRADDGKGDRRMIAGKRFRTPGVTGPEAEKRFDRIEDIWKDNEAFCTKHLTTEPHWNHVALWAANSIRMGERRVPLPQLDDVLATYDEADCVLPPKVSNVVWGYTDEDGATHYSPTVDGIESFEAIDIYEIVAEAFPSVNWGLPKPHAEVQIKSYESSTRESIAKLARARDQAPPDPNTVLVAGTFHEALDAFEEKRKEHFTEPDGTFDGSGHHFLGIIKAIRERRPDFQLAELDFRKCQEEVSYWCDRPEDRRKGSLRT